MRHRFSKDIARALLSLREVLRFGAARRYCTCRTAQRMLLRRSLHTRDHIPLCTSSRRFSRMTA